MNHYTLNGFAPLSVRVIYFIANNGDTHALTDSQRQHLTLNSERFIGWLELRPEEEYRNMVVLEYPVLSATFDEMEKDKKTLLDLLNG